MIDRRKFLGSSDIAAVLGISPWKTPYQLWQEKTSPEPIPEVDTPLLYWGRKMERLIIEEVHDKGVHVIQRNKRFRLISYQPVPLSCQVDFVYEHKQFGAAIGECKFITFHSDEWGESGTQDIPEHYKAQLFFQLAVTGYQEGTVWALRNGELRSYEFRHDQPTCFALLEKAVRFWRNYVIPKIPPPIQTREDALAAMHPFCGLTLAADEDMHDRIRELRNLKTTKSMVEQAISHQEEQLIRKIGIAATAPGVQGENDGKIAILDDAGHKIASWNLQKRSAYSVEEQEYRVLRLHGGKE